MDVNTVRTLYGALAGDRFAFLLSGRFHDDLSPALIALGKEVPQDINDRVTRGRLSFVLVEAFQNIIRHGTAPQKVQLDTEQPMLLLRDNGDGHEVVSMNPLDEAERGGLEQQLLRLRGKDMAQLKELFLRGLERTGHTDRGGAGLGLIEMARRSGHALRHRFVPTRAGRAMFTLQVQVGGRKDILTSAEVLDEVHAAMVQGKVLLLCMGHMGPGIQEAMRPLFGKGLHDTELMRPGLERAYLAAMEYLQLHQALSPMLALVRTPDGQALVLAWRSNPAGARALATVLQDLEGASPAELHTRYRDLLLGRGARPDAGQLALLELARLGQSPLRLQQLTADGGTLVLLQVLL